MKILKKYMSASNITIPNNINRVGGTSLYNQRQLPRPSVGKAAFLIEGCESQNARENLQEVDTCIKLAALNNAPIFDAIVTYSHFLGSVFDRGYCDPKVLILHLIEGLDDKGTMCMVINTLILPLFQKRVEVGLMQRIPDWLENIYTENIEEFRTQVLTQFFKGDLKRFRTYNKTLTQKIMNLSDELSAIKTIAYLASKPSIERVFGLIGASHLSCLDKHGQVISRDYKMHPQSEERVGYRRVNLKVEGRTIVVDLFGGYHGNMSHYTQLAYQAQLEGFALPNFS